MQGMLKKDGGQMKDLSKKHWYCFTLMGKTEAEGKDAHASSYGWFDDKDMITKSAIEAAKESSPLRNDAVLVNVSYLGYMDSETFYGA